MRELPDMLVFVGFFSRRLIDSQPARSDLLIRANVSRKQETLHRQRPLWRSISMLRVIKKGYLEKRNIQPVCWKMDEPEFFNEISTMCLDIFVEKKSSSNDPRNLSLKDDGRYLGHPVKILTNAIQSPLQFIFKSKLISNLKNRFTGLRSIFLPEFASRIRVESSLPQQEKASSPLHEHRDPRCEVVRAHNKESYDFMVGGRQHRSFYWSGLSTNGSVDSDPPNVHAGRHTTSSFYHVVPFYHGVAVSVSLATEMRSNLRKISRCIGPFKPLDGCILASRIALHKAATYDRVADELLNAAVDQKSPPKAARTRQNSVRIFLMKRISHRDDSRSRRRKTRREREREKKLLPSQFAKLRYTGNDNKGAKGAFERGNRWLYNMRERLVPRVLINPYEFSLLQHFERGFLPPLISFFSCQVDVLRMYVQSPQKVAENQY
ncbi:hypothetical protein EAG_13791 [Camponotus floridanus]|uniref:Uncharacterized protein n=1 Tax=Camponotus floridanus TaxID=104421 RepID=E2AGC1_CAMFO|nr:hypothetical protein EAG_13791 [Camponotus floridanus]